jgi:hypothetical protein
MHPRNLSGKRQLFPFRHRKRVKLGENATGTAAGMLFGDIGGKLISVGIIVSIFGIKIMASAI